MITRSGIQWRLGVSSCWTLKERKVLRVTLLLGEKSINLQTPRRGWLVFWYYYYFNMHASVLLKHMDYIHWHYTIGNKIINIPLNRKNRERICGSLRWSPKIEPLDLDRFSLLSLESVCHPRSKIFVAKQGGSLLFVLQILGTGVSHFPKCPLAMPSDNLTALFLCLPGCC